MEDMVERLRKSIEVKTITPEGSARVPSGFYITAVLIRQGPRSKSVQKYSRCSWRKISNCANSDPKAQRTFSLASWRKRNTKLDQQDAQLADFKGKYLGQLPTDEQRNLEMLTATRTRLRNPEPGA